MERFGCRWHMGKMQRYYSIAEIILNIKWSVYACYHTARVVLRECEEVRDTLSHVIKYSTMIIEKATRQCQLTH